MDRWRVVITVGPTPGSDIPMLRWVVERLVDVLKDSPVPLTVRMERVQDGTDAD